MLAKCKDTLKETIQLEDYEEEGVISTSAFREAFSSLSIDGVDDELIDFLLFLIYSKGGSDNMEALRYQPLLELLENKSSSD